MKFSSFTGINNVQPHRRLGENDLIAAENVDIGLSGEVSRRAGYSLASSTAHHSIHQADGFMLAVAGGDLVAIAPNGGRATLFFSIGAARVHYCNLPNGRTAWSNGLQCGITDGAVSLPWGVPVPQALGAAAPAAPTASTLFAGRYQCALTYVRLADGAESGLSGSGIFQLTEPGAVAITDLPVLAGHKINIYLSNHNDDFKYLAGSTTTASFSFSGPNDALALPCRTDGLSPAPAGKHLAFWRGRALVAVGSVLHASLPNMTGLFDHGRDFKQFTAPITLVQPVDDGIYVGTERELAFLAGAEFDKLAFRVVVGGAVVPGSGVAVRGELIALGQGVGQGSAMVCIADRVLVAGFNGGNVSRMSEGRYITSAAEVCATFRMIGRIPQYIAIPQ